MEFINGVEQILHIKRDGVYYPIGCLTSNSFSESVEMLGTTTREAKNGWSTSIPTNQNYSISFSGFVLADFIQFDKITYEDIRRLKRQRERIEWKISRTTDNADYGFGYITSVGDSSSIDEFVSFTGEIVGYGEPVNAFDEIYFGYKDRVEAAGGTLSSEVCTIKLIDKWLNN